MLDFIDDKNAHQNYLLWNVCQNILIIRLQISSSYTYVNTPGEETYLTYILEYIEGHTRFYPVTQSKLARFLKPIWVR